MRHLRKSYGIRGQKTMDERIEQSNFYEDMFELEIEGQTQRESGRERRTEGEIQEQGEREEDYSKHRNEFGSPFQLLITSSSSPSHSSSHSSSCLLPKRLKALIYRLQLLLYPISANNVRRFRS